MPTMPNPYRSLLGMEIILLFIGVPAPMARVQEFWIFNSEFSMLSIISTLWESGEYLLSLVVLVFGIVFPGAKVASKIINYGGLERLGLDRYALVDIFLLAFLVFSAKLSNFFEITLLPGFYFLLAFVLCGIITASLQKTATKTPKPLGPR